ncbi:MAG: AsmA family protein, partial [Candidatus Omnitrophica bacterium]|nr:AsmA family protein [Candidatus Omnitrophota bacterium]
MKIAKRNVLIVVVILCLLLVIGLSYLSSIFLPTKVKSLLIQAIEETTHKKVTVERIQFHVFKGVMLYNIRIFDEQRELASVQEASCRVLFIPIISKRIIIPSLVMQSPKLFLNRRNDGSWNIQDLALKQYAQRQEKPLSIAIYSFKINNGCVIVKDDAVVPSVDATFDHIEASSRIFFPGSVTYDLKAQVQSAQPFTLLSKGEYRFLPGQLEAKIWADNVTPALVEPYSKLLGIAIADGVVDANALVRFKDAVLDCDLQVHTKGLSSQIDRFSVNLTAAINASIRYNSVSNQWQYSGAAKLSQSSISGLDVVGRVEKIDGSLTFGPEGVKTDKLDVAIWDIPCKASFESVFGPDAHIAIAVDSALDARTALQFARDKFSVSLPFQVEGPATLDVAIDVRPHAQMPVRVTGGLAVADAIVLSEQLKNPLQHVRGRFSFSQNQVAWEGVSFSYQDIPFTSSGALTDFLSPGIQLKLSSPDFSFDSIMAMQGKKIAISSCNGLFKRSAFNMQGTIDFADSASVMANLKMTVAVVLGDLVSTVRHPALAWDRIKPAGTVKTEINFSGDPRQISACRIEAKGAGEGVSLYGLRLDSALFSYFQQEGIIDIPLKLTLYDGIVDSTFSLNLNAEQFPYWVSTVIQGLKIEKLKLDTNAKDKDIAGTIQADGKFHGFGNDLNRINGAGKIIIKDGNLWQLNLFKGLGAVLFDQDFFTNIIFREGYCNFVVQDQNIATNNLVLKSNVADMNGSVRIGFDSSLDASLDVHVLDEMVPLT